MPFNYTRNVYNSPSTLHNEISSARADSRDRSSAYHPPRANYKFQEPRKRERERDCLDEFSYGIKEGDETGRKRVLFLRFLARTTSVRGAILWHIYLERLNFSPLLFSLRDINRGFDGFGLVNTEEYGTDE